MMNSALKEEAQAWLAGTNQDDLIDLYLDWKKVSSHFSAELKAVENDHVRITTLKATNAELLEALEFTVANVHLWHVGTGPRYIKAIKMMKEAIRKAKEK